MSMTRLEHIQDQIEQIDNELRAGPPVVMTGPTPIRKNPVDLTDALDQVAARSLKREEEKRANAAWPARRDELLARRRRLERDLEREHDRIGKPE